MELERRRVWERVGCGRIDDPWAPWARSPSTFARSGSD